MTPPLALLTMQTSAQATAFPFGYVYDQGETLILTEPLWIIYSTPV